MVVFIFAYMLIRNKTKEIKDLLKQFPVVGIVGPRQCGKTTLAKSITRSLKKSTVYLDLELSSDLAKLTDAELYLKTHENKLIIIDEIQHKPDLYKLIRALVDQKKDNARFLILGSAAPELLRQSSESLTGRVIYVELSPLSLSEIKKRKSQNQHWFYGGYPKSLLATNSRASRIWLNSYISNYIHRDLPDLGLDISPIVIERFWRMLANYHGGIWNASKFAAAMGVTSPTISRYLYYLCESFLVNQLPAYTNNAVKRLVKSPKIYLRDSGLLHHLIHIDNLEDLHGDVRIGASWEGYVIEQIKSMADERYEMYYYRTHNGAECDLVLCRKSKPFISVEIKYSVAPTVSRGFYECIADLKTKHNFVVVPQSDLYPVNKDTKVIGLKNFLQLLKSDFKP